MKSLQKQIAGESLTCTGQTWDERLQDFEIDWELVGKLGVMKPIRDPIRIDGGLGILYGSLAPNGAVVRLAGIDPGFSLFEGPARVCNSEVEAWEIVKEEALEPGDVLIIRYEGLVGGPGMPEESNIAWFLQDRGYRDKVYILTDGRFSGGQAGQCIGMISPEAALGGPISIVENGDRIRIDLDQRRLDLLIPKREIVSRLQDWKPPQQRYKHGYLARYVEQVTTPEQGGVVSGWDEEGGEMGEE
jgi:dihydroxy-acid dehydratase